MNVEDQLGLYDRQGTHTFFIPVDTAFKASKGQALYSIGPIDLLTRARVNLFTHQILPGLIFIPGSNKYTRLQEYVKKIEPGGYNFKIHPLQMDIF